MLIIQSCFCLCGHVRPSFGLSVRRSVDPSVRRSVPCYFRTMKNIISRALIMTKFFMEKEKVEDNTKMKSK